jgi:hypothetical protein
MQCAISLRLFLIICGSSILALVLSNLLFHLWRQNVHNLLLGKGAVDLQDVFFDKALEAHSAFNKTHSDIKNHIGKLLNFGRKRRRLISFNHTIPAPPEIDRFALTSNPVALIKCANQTKCIQPVLQLKRSYKVYYCKKVSHGVRFYFLVREGLLQHPNIHLVSTPEAAEVIVYLPESAAWKKSECNKPEFYSKLLVLDEGDGPQLFESESKDKQLLMFKRSYVRRHNGIFDKYMGYIPRLDVLPMTYTIADAYVRSTFTRQADRDIELLCTLRAYKSDPARARVSQWVAEYVQARGIKGALEKPVNSASRTVISKGYFDSMHRAQIIVTANPSGWEGDFRLCESLASGALIFVDQMYVPRQYPLVHGRHYVVYDNNNKTDLFEKLDLYRKDKLLARRVALNGYIHSMRFHRAANLVDYAFRTLHMKQLLQADNKLQLLVSATTSGTGGAAGAAGAASTPSPTIASLSYGYTDTGYHMRLRALELKKGQLP